ncbi:MAG: hypothetical protein ACE5GT_00045 [Rhodospirillales bacterium]
MAANVLQRGRRQRRARPHLAAAFLISCLQVPALAAGLGPVAQVRGADLFARWEVYTTAEGLPSNKVMAVAVDGDSIWSGTENGLAVIGDGVVRRVDGDGDLPFPAITSLAVSPVTGDLWIGTLGGLGHLSGGLFERFTQLDSGLANDVVYGVAADNDAIWIATAAGLSRYDLATGAWAIYDTSNTLMHEPWCYAVTVGAGHVYTAVWGSGVLVRDNGTGRFRVHRDPDHEMEIDLFRDDGLIHDVTSAVALGADQTLWIGTYFGLSRYRNRRWRSWYAADSGLAGDFINFMRAAGDKVWIGTDSGLSRFDSRTWHTWRQRPDGAGFDLKITRESGGSLTLHPATGPPSNTIFGVDVDGGDVWLATAAGVAHGLGRSPSPAYRTRFPGTREGEQR